MPTVTAEGSRFWIERRRNHEISEENRSDTEYRYIVHVRALETFINLMHREGINITERTANLSFTSDRRLDMKALQQRGIIRSYSVIRVRTNEDVVEEG